MEPDRPMRGDVFPTTMQSWIGHRLRLGDAGRAEINQHVMSVYAEPLRVYFRGTRDRWLGDAEDIVQGFFADRLARDKFFDAWEESGLALRRWLMNAFCFYLNELRRNRKKQKSEVELQEVEPPRGTSTSPEVSLDKAYVISIVRLALEEARSRCEVQKLDQHWFAFVRHHYQGVGYQEIGEGMGVDAARAAVMARTAARKFQAALRELLVRDGTLREQVDGEIESLLEVSRA